MKKRLSFIVNNYYILAISVSLMISSVVACNLYAQDVNYIDANDAYVDAIGDQPGQQAVNAGTRAMVDRSGFKDQFNTGILNYGLNDNLYYQFSGESIFIDGNPLGSSMTNLTWIHLNSLDFKLLPSWAYGAELLYFGATSNSMFSGDEDVIGSSIDMNLFLASFSLRTFFINPFKEFLQPYLGLGLGLVFGDFDTNKLGGGKHYTTFNGALSYQIVGVQLQVAERGGIMAEVKNMRAYASTSNDPFDKGDGETVKLTLDGVIIGFTFYYRI